MFHPPRPELQELLRAGGSLPLPPVVPPQPPGTVIPPGEVPDVILCVGQFESVDLGGVPTTVSTLPAGVSVVGQTLQGVATESFCEDVYLNKDTDTERRFRLVAIDANTFTPQLTPEISPGYTFSEAEGNYVESCGIVTFSAKFRRTYIRNYSFGLGSVRPLLWQDDLLLNLERDGSRYDLRRYQLPNLTQKTLQRDTTWTPVDLTALSTKRDLALAPITNNEQFIYYYDGVYPDLKLRRYSLTAQAIDTSFVKDIDYYRGNQNLPAGSNAQLVPHAIAVNSNRIYVFLSVIGNFDSTINQSEWYKYDYNWRTLLGSIVQSYDLTGTLRTAECQENLRIQDTDVLPFEIEYASVGFTPAVWKAATVRSVESQSRNPGVFATDDAIYMVVLQGAWERGHSFPFILKFDLTNHTPSAQSSKALLVDGLDDNIQGLHRAANGDFYFGLVTDQSGGFAQLGGQETRGLIKVSGQLFDRIGTFDYQEQAIDYVDMAPPKGTVISNCVGTVGNARGQGNLSIQTYVKDVNNKIRISYPVDYADSAELFVTGQYKLEG